MPTYRVVLTDTNYAQLGEVTDFYDFSLYRRINGTDILSFRVRQDNRFFTDFTLSQGARNVKVYRDNVLQFFGPVWSSELVGDQTKMAITITCVAAGKLADKFTPAGWGIPIADQIPGPGSLQKGQYDRGKLLSTVNYWSGRCNEEVASYKSNRPSRTHPLHIPYRTTGGSLMPYEINPRSAPAFLSQIITDTCAGVFDWKWTPTEPTLYQDAFGSNAGPVAVWSGYNPFYQPLAMGDLINNVLIDEPYYPIDTSSYSEFATESQFLYGNFVWTIATLDYAAVLGVDRSSEITFEYGYGRNQLSGFKFTTDRDPQANHIVQAYNNTFQDHGSGSNEWGHLYSASAYDPPSIGYLGTLMSGEHSLRRFPRQRLEITVLPNYDDTVPVFGVDYDLGDYVSVILGDGAGSTFFQGMVRIHAVTLTLTEAGTETTALTITTEDS